MTPVAEQLEVISVVDGSASEAERFERLFSANVKAILAYALRRTRSPADAADVVAETMLVAWRRIGDVPPGDAARLWLFGVARQVVANSARGNRRRDNLTERLTAAVSSAIESAPTDLVVASLDVRAALGHLDEDDQELLRLSSWEGLSPSEIAQLLAIPVGTVRTRLHRARVKLRTRLAERELPTERTPGTGHEGAEGKHPCSPIGDARR